MKVLLCYPPGDFYLRGEGICQLNVFETCAQGMRACNDLGYCAGVLLRDGHAVELRDYQTERRNFDDVARDIERFAPDFIMISVTHTTIHDDLLFVNKVREITNAKIILKGVMFYRAPKELLATLDLRNVDTVIGGEPEAVICDIVRGEGRVDTNARVADLDSLPFPARELMNNKLYVRPDTGAPIATIQTHRGCPSGCIFCQAPRVAGNVVRFRSPENVFAEIEECFYKFHIRNFFFKADTFTINAEWTTRLMNLIIQSKLWRKIRFTANSRVNTVTPELLKLMKRAGCFMIAFGFESGSDETLGKIKKGTTVAQNLLAARWARRAGIPIYGYFMVGFPHETREHLEQTRKAIFKIRPDFFELYVALPFYGTELFDVCKRAGTIADDEHALGDGGDFFRNNVITGTVGIPLDEIKRWRTRVIKRYYLRPWYVLRRLGDCVKNPRVFFAYARYALRLKKNLDKTR